jgi:hypothetical protein
MPCHAYLAMRLIAPLPPIDKCKKNEIEKDDD